MDRQPNTGLQLIINMVVFGFIVWVCMNASAATIPTWLRLTGILAGLFALTISALANAAGEQK